MKTEEKKYRLPKEFAEKWMAALRSGEYKQGFGTLCDTNDNFDFKYCCMGVAGIVCGKTNDELRGNGYFYEQLPEQSHGIPDELKLPVNGDEKHLTKILSDLNDIRQFTFLGIADWIEQNVELY